MSTIHNISSTFLLAFKSIQGKSKLSPEEIFKSVSLMLGGDGETIKKEQLDKYIADAEAGKVDIDKAGLSALKTMQQNWYRLTDGKDSINVADSKYFTALLAIAFAGGFTSTTTPETANEGSKDSSFIEDIDAYLVNSALKFSTDSDLTKADLTSLLNDVLGGTTDEKDDANADLIGALTNMIARSKTSSTVSVDA